MRWRFDRAEEKSYGAEEVNTDNENTSILSIWSKTSASIWFKRITSSSEEMRSFAFQSKGTRGP